MKKIFTTILLIGSLYLALNYVYSFAQPFNFENKQTLEPNDEYYDNFEQKKVINVAGSYLVLEDGETVRLSGISCVNENGNNLLKNSLINRKIWIYRDGEDEEGISCIYLFIEKPEYPFSIKNSINRIICSKNYGIKENISNGYFSHSLSDVQSLFD